ncbi:YbaB/EbfC family nucleoid-associated protein [Actinophytocola sp.]|uniref:YbaB/EbfC family nucleoid-associated protein n=1 Tax=Actinophytocola sp. TaxID=1872138 RepID=UPI002D247A0C|nr:YbaB/EbfC family nucleoid-associated protein [Actinophytocola sp.]HYQ61927.1 YbaB/EbfC family nucleoid-associated protein [Actinophytocola sp.]
MERSATELTGRLAEYARLADQVKAIRDGVDEIRGTGYSGDGLVTAVAGGRGELLELDLDPRVYREPNATELAAKIVAAVREAAAEAEREATRLAAKLLPPERHEDIDPRFDPALHLLGEISAMEGRQ